MSSPRELEYAEATRKALGDALDSEWIDANRWRDLSREAYISILAGTMCDYAVCAIRTFCESQDVSAGAFELMCQSIHHRIDIAVKYSLLEWHKDRDHAG